MPSEPKKLVVVLGASGRQGGSTARQLLLTDTFHVRAVSRDTTSPSMASLAALGADVATASFDEPASLAAAFAGAHAIFANTTFTSTRCARAESQQGRNIVDAAAAVPSLQHLVWSGAPDAVGMSGGRYRGVVHARAKAEVVRYLRGAWPGLAERTTEVFVPPYFELWTLLPGLYGPVKAGAVLKFSLPVAKETIWPVVPVADTGKVVRAVLEAPEKTRGKAVSGASEMLSLGQLLEQWGEVFETTVEHELVTSDEFEARNVASFSGLFGGEESARVFVKAASEQLQLMEDVTMGKVEYTDVLRIQDVVGTEFDATSWKQFALQMRSKQEAQG